jgi:hypothetical protein
MKSVRNFLLVLLGVGGVAGPSAASTNDPLMPGSVLVFPKFIRGTFNDSNVSGQAVHAVTEFEINARCPDGDWCDPNQVVNLQANWVCPGCAQASFNLQTTIGGTVYFNPEGVVVVNGVVTPNAFPSNATTEIPLPPCDRGYLIVWVTDGSGTAIKFNGLIGDAVIRDQSQDVQEGARSYNAIEIQTGDGVVNTYDPTDLNGDTALDFDGNEYEMASGQIIGPVRYENAVLPEGNVETDLTLLTLDVVTNQSNPTATSVGLNFYDPNENLVNFGTSIACWQEQRLTDIDPSLTNQSMGRKGLVESTFAQQNGAPVSLLGLVETKEFATPNNSIGAIQVRDFAYALSHNCYPVVTKYMPVASVPPAAAVPASAPAASAPAKSAPAGASSVRRF